MSTEAYTLYFLSLSHGDFFVYTYQRKGKLDKEFETYFQLDDL